MTNLSQLTIDAFRSSIETARSANVPELFLEPYERLLNIIKDLQMPDLDLETLLQSQKANLEALTKAGESTMTDIQALAEKQLSLALDTVKECAEASENISKINSVEEFAKLQAEFRTTSVSKVFNRVRRNHRADDKNPERIH